MEAAERTIHILRTSAFTNLRPFVFTWLISRWV